MRPTINNKKYTHTKKVSFTSPFTKFKNYIKYTNVHSFAVFKSAGNKFSLFATSTLGKLGD